MSRIKFIEDTHQYLTEDDKELISVSKFTDQFEEEIDWETIAKRVAAKKTKEGFPTTQKEVLAKWERKRDRSASIGTLYHTIREQELIGDLSPVFYNVPCDTKECSFLEGLKYSIPINQLSNNTVYPELMIYDLEHMICGQADKVIVTKNQIHIWDYKTDFEIKFNAFSSKWKDPQMMLPPVSHIESCNGNKYSLKMSIYMYLLWKANKGRFKPGDIIIEHIHLERNPDDDNIPILKDGRPVVTKIEKIKLPYRKQEVMDMLNSKTK